MVLCSRLVMEFDIPVFDLPGRLPKLLDFFYDGVHFNVRGAREAGAGLAEFIAQRLHRNIESAGMVSE